MSDTTEYFHVRDLNKWERQVSPTSASVQNAGKKKRHTLPTNSQIEGRMEDRPINSDKWQQSSQV